MKTRHGRSTCGPRAAVRNKPPAPSGETRAAAAGGGLVAEAARAQQAQDLATRERIERLAPFSSDLPCTEANLSAVTSELCRLAGMECLLVFEVGQRLLWAKAGLNDNDSFMTWLEAHVPFDRRTAYRYMTAAHRLGTRPSIVKALTGQGVGQAYALMEFSDEQLSELEETGRVGDVALDEVDRMSAAELRAEARKLRSMTDKGRAQLSAAEERIAALEVELHKRPREAAADFLQRLYTCDRTMRDLARFLGELDGEAAWRRECGDLALACELLVGAEKLAGRLVAQCRRLVKTDKGVKIAPPPAGDGDDEAFDRSGGRAS